MPNKYDIIFTQRDSTNSYFVEKTVSGSNKFIATNDSGVLYGADKNTVLSGSVLSASGLYVPSSGVVNFQGSASIGYITGTITNAISASWAPSSGGGGGTTLYTGSTYPITSSWAVTSTSSSFASRVDGTYVGATTGSFTSLFINTSGSISIPLSSSDAGTEGEVRVGPNFLYLYTNSRWIRSPFSQFP